MDIPPGVCTAYLAANGVAFAGKGIQSFAERPQVNTQVSTSFQTTTKATTTEGAKKEGADENRELRSR